MNDRRGWNAHVALRRWVAKGLVESDSESDRIGVVRVDVQERGFSAGQNSPSDHMAEGAGIAETAVAAACTRLAEPAVRTRRLGRPG
jgi:hypothetical protein